MNRILRKLWNMVLITITALAIAGLATSVCAMIAVASRGAFITCMASAAWLTIFALANGEEGRDSE